MKKEFERRGIILCNKEFQGMKFFLDSFLLKAFNLKQYDCVLGIQLATELHMSNYYLNTGYIKTLIP